MAEVKHKMRTFCPRCRKKLKPGRALQSTFVPGVPDFGGKDDIVTLHAGGPGRLVDVLKCPRCGFSIKT